MTEEKNENTWTNSWSEDNNTKIEWGGESDSTTDNLSTDIPSWGDTSSNESNIQEEPPIEDSHIIDPITNQIQGNNIPFVSQVEDFNAKFGKMNSYTPNIPEEKDWMFVYNFILEELEEYKEACEKGDIVGVLDAICDIAYVSLGNGTMLHGLKTKIWPAYQEVQLSNMSKACKTPQEALDTVKACTEKYGEECHVEQVGDMYIVYRTRDRKVMKNINYFPPNLHQYFSEEEINGSISEEKNREDSHKSDHFGSKVFVNQVSPPKPQIVDPLTLIESNETTPNIPESDTEDYW